MTALAIVPALALGAWYYAANFLPVSRFDPGAFLGPEEEVLSLDYRVVQSTPAAWAKVTTLSYNSTTGLALYKEAMVVNPETMEYRRQIEFTITKADFSTIYSALKNGLGSTKVATKQPKGGLELYVQIRFRDEAVLTILVQGGVVLLQLSRPGGEEQIALEPSSALDGFVKVISDLASQPA